MTVNYKIIGERLKEVRKTLGFTQELFAVEVETTRGVISQIELGLMNPSLEILARLNEKHGYSWDFLVFGKSPEKTTPKTASKTAPKGISYQNQGSYKSETKIQVREKGFDYSLTPAVVTVDEGGNDNIVLVDVKAAAGYPEKLQEPTYFKKLPAIKLPNYRNGRFRGFQIEGDSMFDTLENDEWVITKFLDNGFLDIKEGYIHVIVTKTEVTVKRLLNRVEERNKIVCISDNNDYGTFEIDASDVQELWMVKMKLTTSLRSRKYDLQRIVNNLQADVVDLLDRMKKVESKGR